MQEDRDDKAIIKVVITISVEKGIGDARAGRREALGPVLEVFRPYLANIARNELGGDLVAKTSASSLVQETFLRAHNDFPQFEGSSAEELKAWLRQILLHHLANQGRRFRRTSKRQVGREISIQFDESHFSLVNQIPDDSESPSGKALQNERLDALRQAIENLPEPDRNLMLWRHEDSCSFVEIGQKLGCSATVARRNWLRISEKVRHLLRALNDSGD